MEVSLLCPHCKKALTLELLPNTPFPLCVHCGKNPFPHPTESFKSSLTLDQCPTCGSPHMYQQKDFNRKLGVSLLVMGALLAYPTYGISMLVVTGIDFALYRLVKEVGCCYRCKSQFRGNEIKGLPAFELGLNDYYRSTS